MNHIEDDSPQPEPASHKKFINTDDILISKHAFLGGFFSALGAAACAALVFGITVLTSRNGGNKPDA